jgi:hypothetical protein
MKRKKDIKKGEGNMRYKFELSIMIVMLFGLSLAGVASADSVIKTLYVDGVKVGTSTAAQAISFPYQRLTIGAEGSRYYRYNGLNGEIDEFAVFGRVLTDTNVAVLYNAGSGGYVTAVTNANPLLYLRFEDANSSEGSKIANSGSLADVNSTYIGTVGQNAIGFVGKSAVLNGTSGGTGDCMDVCDWDARLSLTNISVAFWVKTTQSSDYPRFFQHNGGNTEQRSYGAMLYPAGPNSIGLIGGGSTGTVTRAINDGAWHHVVVTFNSIKTLPYEYEVMNDDPCVYLKFDHPLPVDSSINHYYVNYSTNAQVRRVPGAIGGSALYLDNSIGGGQQGRAYVWNNYGGTVYRSFPGWTDMWDDGVAPDYLDPDVFAFAPGSISFEFWMRSAPELTPDTYAMLFQQVGGMSYQTIHEPNAPGMSLYTDAGVRKLRVLGGSQWWYPGVNAPLDGNWHHVVVTYDENEVNLGHDMGIELYLDGARYSTTIVDPNGHALLGPELYILMIGAEQNLGYAANAFGGYIDEFAVYAGVLPPERVAAHYAAGQPGTAGQPTNCAEVWARGQGLYGDLNHDCIVDFYDFAIFAAEWRVQ